MGTVSRAASYILGGWSKSLRAAGAGVGGTQASAAAPLPEVVPTTNPALPKPLITKGLLGDRFDCPWAPGQTKKSAEQLWKFWFENRQVLRQRPTPEQIRDHLPYADKQATLEAIRRHKADEPMRFTWVGHATCLVQMNGATFLTDPMFSDRPSASQRIGPQRFSPPGLLPDDLPPVDFVLLSHNHYDHLDTNSVKRLGNRPLWLVPLGIKRWLARHGITNVVEMDWWSKVSLPWGGLQVTCTPTQHWSSRMVLDRNWTLWCGFAVAGPEERFYFGGDTAYCNIYPQLAEECGPFDLAALPIGAYEPRWFMSTQHTNPAEAVLLHKELGAKRSVAIHWGTFPLAADPYLEAPQALVRACKEQGVSSSDFLILRHGESVRRDQPRAHKCIHGGDS